MAGCSRRSTTTSTSSTDAGGVAADRGCSSRATADGCYACCRGEHPDGVASYDRHYRDCYCRPENCAAACASTVCAATRGDAGGKCQACIDAKVTDCRVGEVWTACTADPLCLAYSKCNLECASKR